MKNFQNIDEIFDFAISNEEEACHFYTTLAETQQNPAIRALFTQFAAEEAGHKKKLENARQGDLSIYPVTKVQNLNIAEYLVEQQPDARMNYQDALILAMKKEKKAFQLYTSLAEMSDDANLHSLFTMLAQEEARHKLRFEIEYDNEILTEN